MADDPQSLNDAARPAAFFASPEHAVEAARQMIKAQDWAALARYYDLDGSDTDYASLLSGAFFMRTEPPEAAHPGGFWRYKHPFPPSFQYAFATPADAAGIVTVEMSITIEQGAGAPPQIGRQSFRMRHSDQGFQFLPD